MEFEWDENKRQRIIRARGVDLLYAARIFSGEVVTFVDGRVDYGETRMVSLGLVGADCFVVVHTERQGVTRLITAWKGGRSERSRYEAGIVGRDRDDG